MIRVLEIIPLDRIADGIDIVPSLARYSQAVAKVLAANWIKGAGISEVRAEHVQLSVRIGQVNECWQTVIELDGKELHDEDPAEGRLINEYRWAAAYVWANGQWAVMEREEVRA